jgi:hypothetical protein
MFVGMAIYKRAAIHPTCCTLLNIPIMQQNSVTGNLGETGSVRTLAMRLTSLNQDLMRVESNSREMESCNLDA